MNTSYFTADLHKARDEAHQLREVFESSDCPAHLSTFDWIHFGSQGADFSAWILLLLGYPDSAAKEQERAVELVRQRGSRFSYVSVLTHGLCSHVWRRTPELVHADASMVLALAEEHGFLFRKAEIDMVLGWATAELGEPERGLALLESGYRLLKRTGFRIATSYWMMLFAYVELRLGRLENAHRSVETALDFVEETQERFVQPELLRLRAELRLSRDAGDRDVGGELLQAAINAARQQNARLFELRASVQLARLRHGQRRREDALKVLQPIYEWFTEGKLLKDYLEATALLHELA